MPVVVAVVAQLGRPDTTVAGVLATALLTPLFVRAVLRALLSASRSGERADRQLALRAAGVLGLAAAAGAVTRDLDRRTSIATLVRRSGCPAGPPDGG